MLKPLVIPQNQTPVAPSNTKPLEMQRNFRYYVLNQCLSLSKMLQANDFHITLQGTCFCPFHDDSSHKSAKIYPKSDTSPEQLFCFSEHRSYRVCDFLKLVLDRNPWDEFEPIWLKLSPSQRQNLKVSFAANQNFIALNLTTGFQRDDSLSETENYLKLLEHIEREVKNIVEN